MQAKHEPYYYWQRMKADFKGAKGCGVRYSGDELTLVYHDTDVASWYPPNGHIVLRHGGWTTPYTKERINRFLDVLDIGARLYQHRKVWFVSEDYCPRPRDASGVWCSLEHRDPPTFALTTKLVAP